MQVLIFRSEYTITIRWPHVGALDNMLLRGNSAIQSALAMAGDERSGSPSFMQILIFRIFGGADDERCDGEEQQQGRLEVAVGQRFESQHCLQPSVL